MAKGIREIIENCFRSAVKRIKSENPYIYSENDFRLWIFKYFMELITAENINIDFVTEYSRNRARKKFDIAIGNIEKHEIFLLCELKFHWDAWDTAGFKNDIDKLKNTKIQANKYSVNIVVKRNIVARGKISQAFKKSMEMDMGDINLMFLVYDGETKKYEFYPDRKNILSKYDT